MNNKVILFSLVLILLLISSQIDNSAFAMQGKWGAMHFEPGQRFIYEFEIQTEDQYVLGDFVFWISDIDRDLLGLSMEGEVNGSSFEILATGDKADLDQMYGNFAQAMIVGLPIQIRDILFYGFWQPWMHSPLYLEELSIGWKIEESEYNGMEIEVVGTHTFGFIEGYIVEIKTDYDKDHYTTVSINSGIPLPVMIETNYFDGFSFSSIDIVLVEYDTKTEVAILEIEQLDGPLLEVLDYFQNNGLNVGERTIKAYMLLDAVAGFGVEVNGNEVELYLFDPDKAQVKTVEHLKQADETGLFFIEEMLMEIPVIMNDNIMLTGLEFGTFYVHPYKDDIIEIFKGF